MNANELFHEGKLGAAIDAQLAAVKAHPTDAQRRLFLFEMVMFAGDLERASKQAALVNFPEAQVNVSMDGYRLLTEAEKMRRRVMHEGETPKSFGPLTDECTARIEALAQFRAGKHQEALAILEKNPPPPISGTLNGVSFDTLCDCDDMLAPMLEVCTVQGYFWVPMSAVKSFTSFGPKYPRDLYWLPGTLLLADGQNGPAYLCSLYVDSYKHAEDAVKLGRQTEWTEGAGEPVRGRGQKTLLAGEDVVGLLDVRELEIQQA